MLLLQSDQLVSNNHSKTHDVMEITDKLQDLHDDFQIRFKERKNLLDDLVGFNHSAKNVRERKNIIKKSCVLPSIDACHGGCGHSTIPQ